MLTYSVEHDPPTFPLQRATAVFMGWFMGRKWKNNNKSYIPNGLNYCVVFIVYTKLTNVAAGRINTTWRAAGWRSMLYVFRNLSSNRRHFRQMYYSAVEGRNLIYFVFPYRIYYLYKQSRNLVCIRISHESRVKL